MLITEALTMLLSAAREWRREEYGNVPKDAIPGVQDVGQSWHDADLIRAVDAVDKAERENKRK